MKEKKDRLIVIKEIIQENKICNQEELLACLLNKGFQLTQATLSRDMKQLKIIKSPDINGDYIYSLPNNYANLFSEISNNNFSTYGIISIEFAAQLAVIKTRPGYAMGIASDIDSKATQEIMGTIAGDDTILLIPREGITQKEIIHALSGFIPDIIQK